MLLRVGEITVQGVKVSHKNLLHHIIVHKEGLIRFSDRNLRQHPLRLTCADLLDVSSSVQHDVCAQSRKIHRRVKQHCFENQLDGVLQYLPKFVAEFVGTVFRGTV